MKKLLALFKKDLMLSVSLLAALVSLFITVPSRETLSLIDWKTLATLFMLITILEGFKKEHIFLPMLRLTSRISSVKWLCAFFVFAVFLSSMFVTNDVSLIIFVPLTIIMLRAGGKERFILPVLTFENIAAIRGSLLTPFGSPQNLFLFSQSGVSVQNFMLHMLPLWVVSAALLLLFISVLFRKNPREHIDSSAAVVSEEWVPERKKIRVLYLVLFAAVIITIVTRTRWWLAVAAGVLVLLLVFDRAVLARTDYVLILTFFCFFVFSSSVCRNPAISAFLKKAVCGNEYWWAILLSQVISNVPASIVLWPFTQNLTALLYGLDSAGLCSIIGSLASVINLRLYAREYPGNGLAFLKTFQIISLLFFAIIVVPQFFLCGWRF